MKLKTSSLLIAGALFSASVIPAQANEAMLDLLKVLRDQGTITAQNYELLANAAKADKEASEAVKTDVADVKKKMPKITTKGKIKIESADGNYSFQPIGRVMWDAVATDDDGDGSKQFQGTELRRARLGFEGKVYDFGYKFEADFAGAGKKTTISADGGSVTEKAVAVKDAYVSYNTKLGDGTKGSIKLGQSQIAFGFNTAASSKYMTFMDRPWYADKDTSPARQSGVALKLSGKTWSAATSITQGSLSGGTAQEKDNGTTIAMRGTFVPYKADKHNMIQLGASYMNVASNDDKFSFSNHLTAHEDPLKISSAELSGSDYDGSKAYGFDAVGIFGPFHALAEYNSYTADSRANKDIDVDSYSVEAGYFLTGESMKLKHGLWDGITPKSSAGAWQIATRYENTDIDDGADNQKADMWTVGLNYYANKNVRFMLDYSDVLSHKSAGVDQAEPSAIKFRAQAKW